MPKNKGGKKHRRTKNENIVRKELIFASIDQEYALVNKLLGNSRVDATCYSKINKYKLIDIKTQEETIFNSLSEASKYAKDFNETELLKILGTKNNFNNYILDIVEGDDFKSTKRICNLRKGLKRKKIWIHSQDVILVSLREYDDKADVIHKYDSNEVRDLINMREIPSLNIDINSKLNDNVHDIEFNYESDGEDIDNI